MPKLIAPHGASWRGRALGAGEIIDVSDAEALQLMAHGFTGTAVPRKDLLKLLKGRGLGNLFVKSTDELRALAAVVLAGEAIMEANHDRE